MNDKSEIQLTARYDKDTRRTHAFTIVEVPGSGVRGTLYFDKQSKIPDTIVLRLVTGAKAEAEGEK